MGVKKTLMQLKHPLDKDMNNFLSLRFISSSSTWGSQWLIAAGGCISRVPLTFRASIRHRKGDLISVTCMLVVFFSLHVLFFCFSASHISLQRLQLCFLNTHGDTGFEVPHFGCLFPTILRYYVFVWLRSQISASE